MLSNEQLLVVRGGGITSTFLNSLSRFMENLYKLGQSVGSNLRRIVGKQTCSIG